MGLGKKTKANAKVAKGKTKKHAGKATGNKRLQTKGKAGELAGKAQAKRKESQERCEALMCSHPRRHG